MSEIPNRILQIVLENENSSSSHYRINRIPGRTGKNAIQEQTPTCKTTVKAHNLKNCSK